MKKIYKRLIIYPAAVLVLAFGLYLGCSTDDFFIPGVGGVLNGILVNQFGVPIVGATVWWPGLPLIILRTDGTATPLTGQVVGTDCPALDEEDDDATAACTGAGGLFSLICPGPGSQTLNVILPGGVDTDTAVVDCDDVLPQDVPVTDPDATPTPPPSP